MAFIYEVNGQKVEFEKEPTEKDIDEAAKSLRPAPESRQPKPVEGQGGAAFGVYRPQGRRPEANNDREASKEMPIQTARGVVTGALGGPSDLLNLPGNLYGMATGQPSPYQVPLGSEEWNQMLPFQSDTPQAKLARFGGEAIAPFPSVKGLKAIPGAVRGAGDIVSGAVGTGTGYIAKPGKAPVGYQIPSQRNPIGATFTPPEEFAKFEQAQLPYGQMPEQLPIGDLPKNALDRAAMMLSGGNIPNSGQGAKAFGERLGETYRNPLTAAADIGSMFFTGGVPVLSTLRGGLAGVQALADMRLANKGFTPDLPKILNEYQTGVRPMPGIQPGPMPRDYVVNGPIGPGGMAANTPAAKAAMATTQRVARPQAQPRAEFTLPDVGTHYTAAEQGSSNFGDTFNKAVTARTADLLKDAKRTGQPLSREIAEEQAIKDIKEWRRNNVEAFKPKQEPAGPKLAQESETPALVKTPGEGTLAKPNVEFDRTDWFALQEKVKSGKPLTAGEQSLADKITGRYGPDPFGSGDLTGSKMFNTVAQGETTPVAAVAPTPTAEMPVIETPPKREYVRQDDRVKAQEAERTKDMTPEQIAAEEQANLARMNRMADPTGAFQKALRGDYGSVKTTPKVEPTPVVETPAPTKKLTRKEEEAKAKADAKAARERKVETPYQPGITGESEQTFNNLVEHMRNRGYMSGVERDKSRVKATGEVFTPTPLVDEMLNNLPKDFFNNPTKTALDPAAGDGQFLSEIVLRKIQNGSTHKQALETTYGVELMPDNVKTLRNRLIGGNESLRPIAEQNLLVGNMLDPFAKVPGQTALDNKRMIEVFGQQHIDSLKASNKKPDKQKAIELQKEFDSYNFTPEASTAKPKDVMEMMTGGKQFDNKADFEKQALMDKLAGKITTGSFVDNGMRYEITEINYGSTPRKVLEDLNKPLTQVRVFTERTNKQISGPPPEVPEKSLRQRVEDKMRKRK